MINEDNLFLVGNHMCLLWGSKLTSIEQVDVNLFRFNAIEYGESFYFEMTESEINEELEKINKRSKEIDDYLKTIK